MIWMPQLGAIRRLPFRAYPVVLALGTPPTVGHATTYLIEGPTCSSYARISIR